jgi:hypothetical protein
MKAGRGRPKKFGRPSKAVTVTLPEDVLAKLHGVDADLGRAIVRLTERRAPAAAATVVRAAEITSYGNRAVIVVTPLKALRRLPGVELVPVGDGRALISLAPGQSVSQFELAVRDATTERGVPPGERQALLEIADILKASRGERGRRVRERTIIVLESPRR